MAIFTGQEPASGSQPEAANSFIDALDPSSSIQPEQADFGIPSVERSYFGLAGDIISVIWENDFTVQIELKSAVSGLPAATDPAAYTFVPVDLTGTIGVVASAAVKALDLGADFVRLTVNRATNGKAYDVFFTTS